MYRARFPIFYSLAYFPLWQERRVIYPADRGGIIAHLAAAALVRAAWIVARLLLQARGLVSMVAERPVFGSRITTEIDFQETTERHNNIK